MDRLSPSPSTLRPIGYWFRRPQRWLLNLIYLVFLCVSLPWMGWRIFNGKSRRGWRQKLLGRTPIRTGAAGCVWVHAVSVGEINLLAPVIDELRKLEPDLQIAISTSTETGFDLARKKYSDHDVFFCPYDFSWAIETAIKRLRPQAIVLAELELWPNMIDIATDRQIPVAVINGRMSEKSAAGYQRFAWLTRASFKSLMLVLAQTDQYAQRFKSLGCPADRVHVTGNVKFDGAAARRDNPVTRQLVGEVGFQADDFVLVAGSTQEPEDLMAAAVYQQLASPGDRQFRLVLVPRHPDRSVTLQKKLSELGIESILRTQLAEVEHRPQVLIVNVIGELGHWWGRANAAYVGGSMGDREGQNMIEPAAYGVPVCFGPRTKNFRDVVSQLLDHRAAAVVRDAGQLEKFVRSCLTDRRVAQEMGRRALAVVLANQGASGRTAQKLLQLLTKSSSVSQ